MVALAVAVPMGTVIAIYLSEFANSRVREVAKPILELLGGIPTIVFGYFALLVVTPILQRVLPGLPGFSLLSAGLVMGFMIAVSYTHLDVYKRQYPSSAWRKRIV